MTISERITPAHLERKALIYIRQSTPHQVLTNQESLRLQYALRQRAAELGWQTDDIEVIDADLGQSGATAQHREGFKEVVSRVTLGEVGIILSTEVTRLSRNCSDWYPLLDICGYRGCLIADRDGIYDPASPNGRLLLGLKGQLSELELHTIRTRMTAGLLNKAERGELALTLPIGFVRTETGEVVKDPHREVQSRLELVFGTFLRVKSASKVLRAFREQALQIPRSDRFGDLVWKKPSVAAILSILKNPAYAGAFVYGRSRTRRDAAGKAVVKRLPFGEWKIVVQDKYPAYISWETFEQIQAMLRDNYAEYDRNKSRGVPRPGAILLQGIIYCGECGHKMVVEYKKRNTYLCNYLRQQYLAPVCQDIPADLIDAQVVSAFLQALSPVELDAYQQTWRAQQEKAEQIQQAHEQQLTRLRYEAELAQRRYEQVDPDNRLVASELESRWESALGAVKQAEERFQQQQSQLEHPPQLPPELKDAFSDLGRRLSEIWEQPILTPSQKKALLRCLIDKVVIHRQRRGERVHTRIVWKGGEVTTLEIPITVGAFADLSGAKEMQHIILERSQQGQSDEEIAAYLSAQGYRSPMQPERVLPSTVKSVRLKHRIFRVRSQSHPRRVPGYLTLPQLAKAVDVAPHWIYDRINNGTIQIAKDPKTGLYLFPDEPETLERFKQLKEGKLKNLRFSVEYQDA